MKVESNYEEKFLSKLEADVRQPDRQIEMYFDGYENKDGIVLCSMYLLKI